MAVFVDLIDEKEICYYNSFADRCPRDILKELKHFVAECNLPFLIKFKENTVVNQTDRSNRCGFHCAEFLTTMFRGGSFKKATHFNETDAKADEHKFRKFGYI